MLIKKVGNLNISVIVVSWNNRCELKDCLQSLRLQSNRDFETILIDNHSKDDTAEMVRNDYPEIILKEMECNLGFAEGCNRGIEVVTGDWICTLNSDAIADPDWIATIQTTINAATEMRVVNVVSSYE